MNALGKENWNQPHDPSLINCRCNTSDEMHHNRHKDILRLVRALHAYDEANSAKNTLGNTPKTAQKLRRGSAAIMMTSTTTDTSSETFGGEAPKLRRRERKKAKKNGLGATKDRNVEAFPREDTDFVSESIHLSIYETKGAWEGTYIYDNQQPNLGQEATPDEEVDNMTDSIDVLNLKSPNALTPRQRIKVKKFYTPIKHSSFRGGSRKYSPKTISKTDPYNGIDPQIVFRLGVEIENPPTNSITRKDLTAKLIAAIKEDIDIIAREDAESAMREEGFWRWAGKGAYYAILKTREELDWATGQKKGTPRRETFDEDMEREEDNDDTIVDAGKEEQTEPQSPMVKKAFKVIFMRNDGRSKPDAEARHEDAESEGESTEDDMQDEMVRRHQQRVAGERNLGTWSDSGDRRSIWIR